LTVEEGGTVEIDSVDSYAAIDLSSPISHLDIFGTVSLTSAKGPGIQMGCSTSDWPTASQSVTIAEGGALHITAHRNKGIDLRCGHAMVEGHDGLRIDARWGVSATFDNTLFTIAKSGMAFLADSARIYGDSAGIQLWNGGQAIVNGVLTLD